RKNSREVIRFGRSRAPCVRLRRPRPTPGRHSRPLSSSRQVPSENLARHLPGHRCGLGGGELPLPRHLARDIPARKLQGGGRFLARLAQYLLAPPARFLKELAL